MADELVFYTNPRSRGRIVRWMLEEVGQPYRTELLDYGTTMKAPAYLAINPMGKVPALVHGKAVVTEAGRHLRLSCRRISAGEARAATGRPSSCALLSLDVLCGWTDRGGHQQQEFRLRGAAGTGSLHRLRQLRSGHEDARRCGIENNYLVGDTFSAADVYFGYAIGFGLMFNTIEKRPAFESYWKRVNARPAYARARQIDDALVTQKAAS